MTREATAWTLAIVAPGRTASIASSCARSTIE
jgi:hypothetical protein